MSDLAQVQVHIKPYFFYSTNILAFWRSIQTFELSYLECSQPLFDVNKYSIISHQHLDMLVYVCVLSIFVSIGL